MFEWYRKRKELKRIKKIREQLIVGFDALIVVRDFTIIGDFTDTSAIVPNVDMTAVAGKIMSIIKEIDKEVKERTSVREPLFPKDKKE